MIEGEKSYAIKCKTWKMFQLALKTFANKIENSAFINFLHENQSQNEWINLELFLVLIRPDVSHPAPFVKKAGTHAHRMQIRSAFP